MARLVLNRMRDWLSLVLDRIRDWLSPVQARSFLLAPRGGRLDPPPQAHTGSDGEQAQASP